ncbi:D-alanyl-lipoteichoic acid acyltransferase DltB, MBOAT superfamily [Desulfotomaculum arcticum]|uniref:D-alanyl-lipoteichoic acid acyltransferase DltB, MBOAT superfamily n=1 Tax=Desulfotruncus arcticus DSM 17038 TaxID=1121424 RepID=A0A1I2X1G0_9FIRM|nr:MBOAT family O-acyltransferase [Desulfotruncus arcticus]SFH06867.1 D-alanyl-lipoteichoic acid acyltransferase DltB, MBOAT superfamily [Desulfotomaculum arcticum] [Desulfotruncus arcticus DSM 17038]
MSFTSSSFLIFFPVVTALYFIIPRRFKRTWLLLASYYFYSSWNPKYSIMLATATLITYSCGLLLGRAGKNNNGNQKLRKKLWLVIGISANVLMLAFFKYFDFALNSLSGILSFIGISFITPEFDILLPVGISFYTLQAVGYIIDVYRGESASEKNLLSFSLYMSFFPQLISGPIPRSGVLLRQISENRDCDSFDYNRVKRGLLLMLWGIFQKLVIADRLGILVNQVFDNYANYAGFEIVIAAVFFAFQLYCDFGGYSNIAIGAAGVLGFNIPENFKQPYFSLSVKEFWRRWHISLSTWLRDYLYIPLGGNRKGKLRKHFNTMLTFLVSGLWHGASWHYVAWGGLHGLYLVLEDVLKPVGQFLRKLFKVNTACWSFRFFRGLLTFVLVDFAWIFFRANGTLTAFRILKNMISDFNPWIFFNGSIFKLGLDQKDFVVVLVALLIVIIVDWMHEKGSVRDKLASRNLPFRWLTYFGVIFAILIFGVYGPGYDALSFFYFQF